jgi:hypothetical protein
VDLGPYRSVFQEYHHQVSPAAGEYPQPLVKPPQAHWPPSPRDVPRPFLGEERNIPLSLVLSLITCGLYGFVWMYKIGDDLRKSLRRDEPRAGLDLFLTLLTCGLWGIYVAYKYPVLIAELQQKRGLPKSDLSLVCILLAIFSLWKVYGFGLIGLVLMQNELNRIWRSQRQERG